MIDAIRGAASGLKSLGSKVSLSWTGNVGVGVRRWKRSPKWRYIGSRRVRIMKKIDESEMWWIIREKTKGTRNRVIAESMGVSTRWVQKIWARYKRNGRKITYPKNGRPFRAPPTRQEISAILSARAGRRRGAVALEARVRTETGIHIPHNAIHRTLKDMNLTGKADKGRKKKWIRYEREYSNSLWHTDYKMLPDGSWFICYLDDASRFVTGWGVFAEATARHALEVLDQAIADHGKPASIMTDHGSQFYASGSEKKRKGTSRFEERLVELDIRQILAGVRRPQTNGKVERLHGTIQRALRSFEEESAARSVRGTGSGGHVGGPFHAEPARPAIDRLMHWYNNERDHMSLDWENLETPAQAFVRKMPPKGRTVVDTQTGEEYRVD